MDRDALIYVAGHRGLVGSALCRRLTACGYRRLLTRTRAELDLQRDQPVQEFFRRHRPDYVFLAAAKVGGIHANRSLPVDFLLHNLRIQNNVLEAAWKHRVKGLLFLGSSCIYPRLAPQPLKEQALLSGALEPTNEPYAIAKIAGIELCEAFNRQYGTRFLSVMPTNLYGPGDRYDLEHSHVLPALMRKFHLAALASRGEWGAIRRDAAMYGPIPREVSAFLVAIGAAHGQAGADWPGSVASPDTPPAVRLWGTGRARREFLHCDDLAAACVFLMENLERVFALPTVASAQPGTATAAAHLINIGCGKDLTIAELAELVAAVVGYRGAIVWDPTMPDGTPQKLLDLSKIERLGWKPQLDLKTGIEQAYRDYLGKIG